MMNWDNKPISEILSDMGNTPAAHKAILSALLENEGRVCIHPDHMQPVFRCGPYSGVAWPYFEHGHEELILNDMLLTETRYVENWLTEGQFQRIVDIGENRLHASIIPYGFGVRRDKAVIPIHAAVYIMGINREIREINFDGSPGKEFFPGFFSLDKNGIPILATNLLALWNYAGSVQNRNSAIKRFYPYSVMHAYTLFGNKVTKYEILFSLPDIRSHEKTNRFGLSCLIHPEWPEYGKMKYEVWNFLNAGGDILRARNRLQACKIRPYLIPLIGTRTHDYMSEKLVSPPKRSREIIHRIDNGLPFIQELGRILDIPTSILNLTHPNETINLARMNWLGHSLKGRETRKLICAVHGLLSHKRDKSNRIHLADTYASSILAFFQNRISMKHPLVIDLLSDIPRASMIDGGEAIHWNDASRFITRALLVAARISTERRMKNEDCNLIAARLFRGRRKVTFSALSEMSKRWHSNDVQEWIRQKIRLITQRHQTPPPLEWRESEFAEGNAKWLTDAHALLDEGEAMSHCVGGYYPYVKSGKKVLISLKDREGNRATASFHPVKEGHPWNLEEIKGIKNSLPSPLCQEMAEKIAQQLARPAKDFMRRFPKLWETMDEDVQDYEEVVCFMHQRKGDPEAAHLFLLQFILNRRIRGMTTKELAEWSGLHDFL
jgi:hypothetical protein